MPGGAELWGSVSADVRQRGPVLILARSPSRAAAERAQLPVVPDGFFPKLVRKGSDLLDMRGECLDEDYARVV